MKKLIILTLMTTIILSSCQPKTTSTPLEIKLETPSTAKINEEINAKLIFKNNSEDQIRIHFINYEPFRFNSQITVLKKEDKSPINPPFIAPPHGYIISEKDFYMVEPGKEISFNQKIKIQQEGNFILRWNYENKRTKWEGGIETLDGITKPLFEGKEVKYLWTGKLITENEITLTTT